MFTYLLTLRFFLWTALCFSKRFLNAYISTFPHCKLSRSFLYAHWQKRYRHFSMLTNFPLKYGTGKWQISEMCFTLERKFLSVSSQRMEKPSLEVAPTTWATFSSFDLALWPMILTYELDRVRNHHAKHLQVKGHFVPKLFSGHTHTTDRLLYTDHWSGG